MIWWIAAFGLIAVALIIIAVIRTGAGDEIDPYNGDGW